MAKLLVGMGWYNYWLTLSCLLTKNYFYAWRARKSSLKGKNYHSLIIIRRNLLITEVFCKLSLVSGTQYMIARNPQIFRKAQEVSRECVKASFLRSKHNFTSVFGSFHFFWKDIWGIYTLASSGFVFLSVSSPLWSYILIPWYNCLFQDSLMSIVPSTELNCLK